jgi:hypothetical protein
MSTMTQDEFNRVIGTYDAEDSMRATLYYRALNLIAAGFVIDAHILILATWNFGKRPVMRRLPESVTIGALSTHEEAPPHAEDPSP